MEKLKIDKIAEQNSSKFKLNNFLIIFRAKSIKNFTIILINTNII